MNIVLEMIKGLEGKATFDECLSVLESARLNDEQLRAVLGAKFYDDPVNIGRAYAHYGVRLVDPTLMDAVAALTGGCYDRSRPIDGSVAVLG